MNTLNPLAEATFEFAAWMICLVLPEPLLPQIILIMVIYSSLCIVLNYVYFILSAIEDKFNTFFKIYTDFSKNYYNAVIKTSYTTIFYAKRRGIRAARERARALNAAII